MATISWKGNNNDLAHIQWTDSKGRHKVSLGKITTKDAETIRLAKELELRNQVDSDTPNFGDFCHRYTRWHSKEYPDSHFRTKQIIDQYLKPSFGKHDLGIINPADIDDYKHERLGKHATINKELECLHAIMVKADEWGFNVRVPRISYLQIRDSKPPHFYDADELQKIYKNSEHWAIWKFMANTGIRRGEFMHLRERDFHVQEGAVRILSTEADRTKAGEWRLVPLGPGGMEAHRALVLPYPFRAESMSRNFKNLVKRLKLGGSLHSLRHTFCSHLAMQDKNLTTIQKLAGHSTIKVTEKYAHLSPSYLANSTQDLDI
jgi:integrase